MNAAAKIRPRHIVLIVLDTARADAFESNGAPSGATPAFAKAAAMGQAAPYAIAPSSWTLPSHVAMLLGISHREAGLAKARQTDRHLASQVIRNNAGRYLPDFLSRSGYHTVGVSTNPWVHTESGFATGFDEFHEIAWGDDQGLGAGRFSSVRWGHYGLRADGDHGLAQSARIALRWMCEAKQRNDPSFLFMNLMECHSPCLPPRPFNELGPLERIRSAVEARKYHNLEAIWLANLRRAVPPEPALRRMRRLYQQSIRYMDEWFRSFMESLEKNQLLAETLIIVTSDHGENIGEGARLGHCFSLDNRLIHVPLITVNAVHPIPGPVFSLIDLPAVIARELALDHHPWAQDLGSTPVAVSQMEGVGDTDDPRVQDFAARHRLSEEQVLRMTADAICATNGGYKLLRSDDKEVLFDLRHDPFEIHQDEAVRSTAAPRAVTARLREAIDRALSAQRDDANAASPFSEDPSSADAQRRLAEQMRLLGYL